MAVVQWKSQDGIAVVEMCNAANTMNLKFAEEMHTCLDQILADGEMTAMVLTSTDERNFSQGVDLEWMGKKFMDGDTDPVKEFLYLMDDIFKRFLLYPIPVIAAINGHAFGNGAILSCACDFRFMKRDRGYFCFPEVDVSVPFFPGMIAFVAKAIPDPFFTELLLTGRRVTADELFARQVIQKASDNVECLMEDALAFAATFKKKRGIFGELKKRKHKSMVEIIDTEHGEIIETLNLMVQE
ncbi:MAG: enoyl-CoA hydratase/isomerase family protein [Desulfobacterales bacterium]|nr:enoyl-CoA hydratase/isomerase family protein [Desulfobacterales bacterium]